MLCCGDLCSPFIINLLEQNYKKPIHIVLGNNDGDVVTIIDNAKKFSEIYIHGEYFRGEFDGKTVAMNHYPDKARVLAKNGGYDLVCYGHNHILKADEHIGETLLINPGAVMGYNGKDLSEVEPSFLVLDTDTMKAVPNIL